MTNGSALTRAAVSNFQPSSHAFAFTNAFPRQPVLRVPVPGLGSIPIGDASRGLCGGMIYAVRDMFEFGVAPPAVATPPDPDSPLYRYIVRRLFDSFDGPRGVLRYYRLMSSADADTDLVRGWLRLPGATSASVAREWPHIRHDLDRGLLSPLGIITTRSADPMRLGLNHQVLAYAYEQRGRRVTLRVYDPNTPRWQSDDVTLSFDVLSAVPDTAPRAHLSPRTGISPRTPLPPVPPAGIEHTIAIGGRPVRAFFRSRYRRTDPRPALTWPRDVGRAPRFR
ncbi:hypothetical protein Ga0074812_10436 [Parafrankia irregularis]|uniref:Uncharacterized protein n=1 Tax=Parafrankia irregularis TaxID=795642 RepID=A0A0S4QI99_9ACTN|nr:MULTISPECIES: hypothetical protein [Parafrankia]MBE3204165.1 hypothetical protein [Parafrankia sp. CH37]CUU54958.1 hypothetical protein Ga0074812_10436 [Parafrankia irregularis]